MYKDICWWLYDDHDDEDHDDVDDDYNDDDDDYNDADDDYSDYDDDDHNDHDDDEGTNFTLNRSFDKIELRVNLRSLRKFLTVYTDMKNAFYEFEWIEIVKLLDIFVGRCYKANKYYLY